MKNRFNIFLTYFFHISFLKKYRFLTPSKEKQIFSSLSCMFLSFGFAYFFGIQGNKDDSSKPRFTLIGSGIAIGFFFFNF